MLIVSPDRLVFEVELHACSNFPLRAHCIHRKMQELTAHCVTGLACV